MDEFPFQLLIKRSSAEKQTDSLLCTALLRAIPGRRAVFEAKWNGKNVIVKVFSHKIHAKRHLHREWKGLVELARRGLNAPSPLFYGRTENGQWAIVTEKIVDSSVACEIFHKEERPADKLRLLTLICTELARQHSKGVLQKDLHLGNFLVTGDDVFVLDTGQIRFQQREVGRKRCISQLAMLACNLKDNETKSMAGLCDRYFKARGLQLETTDEQFFQRQMTIQRNKGVKRGLKKSLRTSKRYLRITNGKYIAVFDRSFCRQAEPEDFLKRVDSLMDGGEILKSGHTCYVSRLRWNDKDIVVKRYNHKGFIHSLRHTIKGSRARLAWLHAHRLTMLQIPTPKPLAYIEWFKGPLVWKSYLVTEYVQGQRLYDFLQDDKVTDEQHLKITAQVNGLLDKLDKYHINHGDLKPTNILITNNGPVLIDLDGVKVYKCNWTHRTMHVKGL